MSVLQILLWTDFHILLVPLLIIELSKISDVFVFYWHENYDLTSLKIILCLQEFEFIIYEIYISTKGVPLNKKENDKNPIKNEQSFQTEK